MLFNNTETEIDKEDNFFSYLTFQINNVLIPMQIDLLKLATTLPRERLVINNQLSNKYILARATYPDNKFNLIISEIPVFAKPSVSCVELIDNLEKCGELEAVVYERFIERNEEVEQETESEHFVYNYYKDN